MLNLKNQMYFLSSITQTLDAKSAKTQAPLQRLDPATEKLFRQLIEWIRVKDTESLIDALEAPNNQIDINFTDDVGQTLLNWVYLLKITNNKKIYACKALQS